MSFFIPVFHKEVVNSGALAILSVPVEREIAINQ